MELHEFHLWVQECLGEIAEALPKAFQLTLIGRDTTSAIPGSGFVVSNDDPDAVIRVIEASKDARGKTVIDLRQPHA
jgi:hypothetical protein